MATINNCELPDDLHYLVDKHVWAKEMENGNLRVGMTSVAVKLSGGSFIAVTPKKKKVGKEIAQGKSVATVESSKFVGPVPAPVTGILVEVNTAVAENPDLARDDPYGQGWIAELQPTKWEEEKGSLVSGAEGLAAYKTFLESEGVDCAA